MAAPVQTTSALEVARAFADAYARGDAPSVAALLAADVHEREVTPGAVVDQRGPEAVVGEAVAFVRAYGRPEVLEHVVEPFGHLVHWCTRWRLGPDGGDAQIEWHAYLTVEDGLITRLDVVCSGLVRPA